MDMVLERPDESENGGYCGILQRLV